MQIQAKDLNRNFFKIDTWMANKHSDKCSASYVVKEMLIKVRYNILLKYYKQKITDVGEDFEELEPSYMVDGNWKCCRHFGKIV